MEWWHKAIFPMRRVWIGVATRLGLRKSGLVKLRNDVRSCEYEDVRVMWEMLKRSELDMMQQKQMQMQMKMQPPTRRPRWSIFHLATRAPYLCRGGY